MALNPQKLASVETAKQNFLSQLGGRKANKEGKPYSFTCSFSSKTVRSMGYSVGSTPEEAITKAIAIVQATASRPTRVYMQAGIADNSTPGMSSFSFAMFEDPSHSANL